MQLSSMGIREAEGRRLDPSNCESEKVGRLDHCNFPGKASSKRLQMKLDLGTLRNTGVLYIIP